MTIHHNIVDSKSVSKFPNQLFSTYSIGDWEGEEELAAEQFNKILATLDKILPGNTSQDHIICLSEKIWEDWYGSLNILGLTCEQVYVYSKYLVEDLIQQPHFKQAA